MKRYFQINFFLVLMLVFACNSVQAQSKLKAANRQFENLTYLDAIRLYEEYLREKTDPVGRMEALKKLAYSYRKMQDTRNAERIYADLLRDYPDVESENYLYYAQALAGNQKYRESQKYYSVYGEKQSSDLRGKRFTVSYMDVNRFYRDSSSYKVDYLSINSRQADFSPMYYKGGLVFCSARDETGAVKRVFGWNQTPFLDLFFVADTSELKRNSGAGIATAVGGLSASNSDAVVSNEPTLSKVETFSRTLNTKYHEGPMVFFKGEEKMVFTRNNYSKGKAREAKDGTNKLKLFTADLVKGTWNNIKEVPFNSNEYSNGHPALTPDNTKMYYVSDMPGGYGGTDIYVVEYNNGSWGSPVNLGKEVNTEGNEMFPFIDEMGNLYFSSDGHEGLGGLDVFFAEMKEGVAYKGVQNLGAPINSEKDDFGLITDARRSSGYFSSNRKRGVSDDNIYSFRRMCKEFTVIVYDATTKTPLENVDIRTIINGENRDLRVTQLDGTSKLCLESNSEYEFKAIKEGYQMNSVVFSTKSNSNQKTQIALYLEKGSNSLLRGVVKSEVNQKPIPGVQVTLQNEKDKTQQTVVTGTDGGYEFEVKPGADHKIVAQKDRFATNTETIGKVKGGKSPATIIENVQGMYGEGDIFKLKNIYYDLDKYFIRPDAARELEAKVIPLLRKYPDMKIEIRSHTDARSDDTYNMQLSANRARAVIDYLLQRGIDSSRLVSNGYGESEPTNECVDGVQCNEKQHQENRRTEFRILAVK
jgi:outer membrane protein OmpA-like peptidoglycan-associated protein